MVRRLRLIDETLDELAQLRDVDAVRLEAEPLTRAAAERLLQVVVGLGGAAPTTGRQSFAAAAAIGAIEPDLADLLAPSAGLRNVLVHRYIEIDVSLVADAVGLLLELGPRYTVQVARFLRDAPGGGG